MAKCPICNSRKGKRFCQVSDTFICSLCCAEKRSPIICTVCEHYREPKQPNKYTDFPMFTIQQMDANLELQGYSNIIESTFCTFDFSVDRGLTDHILLKILELLLDKYYFKENILSINDEWVDKGFSLVTRAIREELADVPDEVITKIIGSIYFVARRRSKGNREYLDFIHQYVGIKVVEGLSARIIPHL